jgi:hypothetical protein
MITVGAVADALRAHAGRGLVAAGALRADSAAPKAADLAGRYASLLAGALGSGARGVRAPTALEAARSMAASSKALIYVELEIANGELRVSADVYPVPHNIWDRCRNPAPGPIAHAFASARVDAEVRSYLAPISLVALHAEKAAMDEGEVVALACDDLDGDGSIEVLSVSRRNISVSRVRQGKLSVERRTAWSVLSPIAPSPWREPLGYAVVSSAAFIDVGVTDRARSVRLDPQLGLRAPLDGIPVPQPAALACARPQVGVLSEHLYPCSPSDRVARPLESESAFDAFAAARVIGPDGSARDVWAARDPSDSKLQLRDTQGRSASIGRCGAQVAIADLDLDGDPEVISSRDVLEEGIDALVVRTWSSAGAVRDRLTVPVAAGVSAVAVCPPDGPSLRAVVMASRSELWVLR